MSSTFPLSLETFFIVEVMPLSLDLEIFIISLDNRIFSFFLRKVICIGVLPLSLGFKEIHSCPSWLSY